MLRCAPITTRVTLIAIVAGTACTGTITHDNKDGLTVEKMSPEEGLGGSYVAAGTEVRFHARTTRTAQGSHFVATVRTDGRTILAELESDFDSEPVMSVGGVQLTGLVERDAQLTPEEHQSLSDLLISPAGVAFGKLVDELPWHVDGMHHEFLALHTMYVSLRAAARADYVDDGFSLEENAARIQRLTGGADLPGHTSQAVTSATPYPDLYICPGQRDKCVGKCGTGCQGTLGVDTYTCACLRHDLDPNFQDPTLLGNAVSSAFNPSLQRSRGNLNDCAPSDIPQSPAYHCGSYGSSQLNSRAEYSDGKWWCYDPSPGEVILSPGGAHNFVTDWNEHWGWVAGRYKFFRRTDGTVHRFTQTGRIKMGISGKASGVAVVSVAPGSALCNQFGGTCEASDLPNVTKEHIENIIPSESGCWFNSTALGGTTGSTGSTCPDLPFYHKLASHSFGWYDALHIPPGDYLLAVVSVNEGGMKGHVTVNASAYQGNGGNWQPNKQYWCSSACTADYQSCSKNDDCCSNNCNESAGVCRDAYGVTSGGGGGEPEPDENSCEETYSCGDVAPGGCWCDDICEEMGDCCYDGPC